MREATLTLPELALLVGTRAAAGAGLALLLGDRLSADQRKSLGWGLLMVGLITTIPLAAQVLGKSHSVNEQSCRREERELALADYD